VSRGPSIKLRVVSLHSQTHWTISSSAMMRLGHARVGRPLVITIWRVGEASGHRPLSRSVSQSGGDARRSKVALRKWHCESGNVESGTWKVAPGKWHRKWHLESGNVESGNVESGTWKVAPKVAPKVASKVATSKVAPGKWHSVSQESNHKNPRISGNRRVNQFPLCRPLIITRSDHGVIARPIVCKTYLTSPSTHSAGMIDM
jgi:hypothetical protein